jgi:hypothetical protein
MRDLRPDELNHVYGGNPPKGTNRGKGTEKTGHNERSKKETGKKST